MSNVYESMNCETLAYEKNCEYFRIKKYETVNFILKVKNQLLVFRLKEIYILL